MVKCQAFFCFSWAKRAFYPSNRVQNPLCATPGAGANYLAGRLAEEQRTDARRAQAAVGVGNDLVHEDPE